MKKIFFLLVVIISTVSMYGRSVIDSIDVGSLTTDTMIVVSKSFLNFGGTWSAEFEYSDLNADDATIDIGTRLEVAGGATGEVADSTFKSFGDIIGVSFPYTLNVTGNADAHYGKASILTWHPDRFGGTELLIYITKGSVTSGYIRYKIIW